MSISNHKGRGKEKHRTCVNGSLESLSSLGFTGLLMNLSISISMMIIVS